MRSKQICSVSRNTTASYLPLSVTYQILNREQSDAVTGRETDCRIKIPKRLDEYVVGFAAMTFDAFSRYEGDEEEATSGLKSYTIGFVDRSDKWTDVNEGDVFKYLGRVHSRDLARAIRSVAIWKNWNVPILIEGEHGVGKRLLAESIHRSSLVKGKFTAVDCIAHSESEFNCALRGTGSRKGLLGEAQNGTLYLEQIDKLGDSAQSALMELVEHELSSESLDLQMSKTSIRLIAACNHELLSDVNDRTFRRDLYSRLRVGHVKLLPLRNQLEAVYPLFLWFVEQESRIGQSEFERRSILPDNRLRITDDNIEMILKSYRWPGNIDELLSFAKRCTIDAFARQDRISEKSVLNLSRDFFEDQRPHSILGTHTLGCDRETNNKDHNHRLLVRQALLNYPWTGDFESDYSSFRSVVTFDDDEEQLVSDVTEKLLDNVGKRGLAPPSLSVRLVNFPWPQVMRDLVLSRVILVQSEEIVTTAQLAKLLGYSDSTDRDGARGGLGKALSRLKITRSVRKNPRLSEVLDEIDIGWIEQHRR